MIKALEYAPASLLAPFAYIQLLWVSILGVLVFGDFPDAVTLIGMGWWWRVDCWSPRHAEQEEVPRTTAAQTSAGMLSSVASVSNSSPS